MSTCPSGRRTGVAIEPLWDWNSGTGTVVGFSRISCCNRTIMGLKLGVGNLITYSVLELQSNHYGIETPVGSFLSFPFLSTVAIEPLWDWNSFLLSFPAPLLVGTPFSPQEGVCPYLVGTITQSPNGNGYKVIRLQDFERVFSKTYSAERRKSRYGVLDAGLFGQKPTL